MSGEASVSVGSQPSSMATTNPVAARSPDLRTMKRAPDLKEG
jgi:hypothetical protein